jgi:hypothetical protein
MRTDRALFARFAVACATLLVPAAAQAGEGFEWTRSAASPRSTMVADAQCLIDYDQRSVSSFLKSVPGDQTHDAQAGRVLRDACLANEPIRPTATQLRGFLYVALYRDRFAAGFRDLVDPAMSATVWPRSSDQRFLLLQQFSECVVRENAQDARAVVLAQPGSAAESAALSALQPHLGGCAMHGSWLTFNRMALAGILAEALYRLTPSASGAGI